MYSSELQDTCTQQVCKDEHMSYSFWPLRLYCGTGGAPYSFAYYLSTMPHGGCVPTNPSYLKNIFRYRNDYYSFTDGAGASTGQHLRQNVLMQHLDVILDAR